jgi:F0F1-type ATP synthase assembly protein I
MWKPEHKEDKSNDRMSLRWMSVGIEYMGVCGIFTYAGYYVDKRYGTEPWLMVAGLVVAMIGMTYLLIKETASWRK